MRQDYSISARMLYSGTVKIWRDSEGRYVQEKDGVIDSVSTTLYNLVNVMNVYGDNIEYYHDGKLAGHMKKYITEYLQPLAEGKRFEYALLVDGELECWKSFLEWEREESVEFNRVDSIVYSDGFRVAGCIEVGYRKQRDARQYNAMIYDGYYDGAYVPTRRTLLKILIHLGAAICMEHEEAAVTLGESNAELIYSTPPHSESAGMRMSVLCLDPLNGVFREVVFSESHVDAGCLYPLLLAIYRSEIFQKYA